MTPYAIEIRGLGKKYRGFALEDVSFSLPSGFVMGLVGPNGAGKTTIVKAILDLVAIDRGEVRVFGLSPSARGVEVRSRIGFVFDEPRFVADATLEEHRRAIAPFYPKWNHSVFDDLSSRFALPRKKKFRALSHGMKTKFALVLALSHDADLLVLDEPTSGLDPIFRRQLLDLLAERQEDGRRSILFSTHIVSDLDRIADFVTFVRGGRVVLSVGQDELDENWGVVRGDESVVSAVPPELRRGLRRGAHGVEILTADASAARRALGSRAIVERASLEEIMLLMSTEEEPHVATSPA